MSLPSAVSFSKTSIRRDRAVKQYRLRMALASAGQLASHLSPGTCGTRTSADSLSSRSKASAFDVAHLGQLKHSPSG